MLRLLAFLLVFLHHSAVFGTGLLAQARFAGAFGLCLFFFLSAFLITDLLEREAASTGTIRLGALDVRRILRIWPLYFAVILVDFIHMHLRQPGAFTLGRLLSFLLLSNNWFVAHHGFLFGSCTVPLWSISIEEQFYLLWPSVRRYAGSTGSLLFSCLTLVLAYGVLVRACQKGTNVDTTLWVNSFVQFQFFASGALTALLLRGRQPSWSPRRRWTLFASGLLAFFFAQTLFHVKVGLPRLEIVPGYLLVNAGCLAIFLSMLGSTALGRRSPLVYLGKISFGLYSFHYGLLLLCGPVADAWSRTSPLLSRFLLPLRAVIALVCTIAIAAFSYHFFEAPILRLKRRFEVIRTRPVGG